MPGYRVYDQGMPNLKQTRREALLRLAAFTSSIPALAANRFPASVSLLQVLAGGIQPQAVVAADGCIHLLFYSGDPFKGDLYYAKADAGRTSFSKAMQVNSQRGSAIAAGTIRGGQIALGAQDQVHVVWNGSNAALPAGPRNPDSGKAGNPLLYSRLNDRKDGFEPQRNLMKESFGLDGGGSVAADKQGNVYVGWHGVAQSEAKTPGLEGEGRRRVWISKSTNAGASFARESAALTEPTGACGCCGMKLFCTASGDIYALYRTARNSVHRDIYLLESRDRGKTFAASLLHKWDINACPMSSMDLTENNGHVLAAWETEGRIFWTNLTQPPNNRHIYPATSVAKGQKHPRIALSPAGQVLLIWTEGTRWQKGGNLAWQLYDPAGVPIGDRQQHSGIPAWSFAAVIPRPNSEFAIIY